MSQIVNSPRTLDDLGVDSALNLLAVLLAQEERRLVAPVRRLTLTKMENLRQLGLIEVPWPDPVWPVAADSEITPLEGLQWRYVWPAYERPRLAGALKEFLQTLPMDHIGAALRYRLWNELAEAEAEAFLEDQLARSRFDIEWAADFRFVYRDTCPALSIAQWRYCAWAAVRHGALMQTRGQTSPRELREGIYGELRRRASAVSSRSWQGFEPRHGEPRSATSATVAHLLIPLGRSFFMTPPSFDAVLLSCGRP
jgi:hypothetical protein